MKKIVAKTTPMSQFRLLDQQRLKKLKQGIWADDKKRREREEAKAKQEKKG